MNEDEKRFLKVFRQVAPSIEATDDMVLAMRSLCVPLVSKVRFGLVYEQALAYLVAHRLTIQNIIKVEAQGNSDGSGGATASTLIAGSIVSEKEGDLSRSFGASGFAGNKISSIDPLEKTIYGIEFKRLRAMRIVTGITRFG